MGIYFCHATVHAHVYITIAEGNRVNVNSVNEVVNRITRPTSITQFIFTSLYDDVQLQSRQIMYVLNLTYLY